MKQRSATLEGFRAMFRHPAVGFGEIAWRWSFGGAAVLLACFGSLEYLDTLPVSSGDLFLLNTRHPFLVSQALAHIFGGSGPRAARAVIVLVLALGLAWLAAASWGRAVTLEAWRTYFHASGSDGRPSRFTSLVGLNILRLAAALAAVAGCLGAFLLGAVVSPDRNPSPFAAFFVFLTVVMLVAAAWTVVNWFLSLAAVFAGQGEDTLGAVAAAIRLCGDRIGAVAAASAWFGLAHLVAFVIATSVVAFPLAFAGVMPAGVVLGGVLLVTLLYFFVVDFLYAGRLASYVFLVSGPRQEDVSPVRGVPTTPAPAMALENVDRDEVILSDGPRAAEENVDAGETLSDIPENGFRPPDTSC
jgi:hypothetical protein